MAVNAAPDTVDHRHAIRILALAGVLLIYGSRTASAPRSEQRDQAQAQRDRTKAPPRSSSARRQFQRLYPCPSTGKPTGTCPGYVVDHIIQLKRGGPDETGNMQWQTTAEARAKDRIE